MSFLAYECTELHIYTHTHTHSHIHIYLTLSLCSKDCILFMYLLRPSPLRVVSVCGEHLGRRECCTVHPRGQHLSAQKPRNITRSLHPSIFCILRTLAEIPELLFLSRCWSSFSLQQAKCLRSIVTVPLLRSGQADTLASHVRGTNRPLCQGQMMFSWVVCAKSRAKHQEL